MVSHNILFARQRFVLRFLPNLKYQLKNKYPPLARDFTKGYTIQLSHMSFTTSVTCMSLITTCAIFCSLKFHVVWTSTFFGDTMHLPPDKSENDQDSDSD
jgi:hypothetical protein